MLGLSAILKLSESEMPVSLHGSLSGLIKYLVKLSQEIIELRNKEDDKSEKEEADEV